MALINWVADTINKDYRPTLYPGEKSDDWEIPKEISADFHRLNSLIENKYSREFLKICAFYNKMFPSLKNSDWNSVSYNVQPFTSMDQERADTGTGMQFNYLKQIIDQITSRLGTISFVPMVISEDQSYEFVVYKDEVERVLRMYIRNDKFNRASLEAFHDAAVLGYAHAFIDPYTGQLVKGNDYEIGMFESQFNKGQVVQMLYRDYAFPVSEALKYLTTCGDEQKKAILEDLAGKNTCDFKMYFNCMEHKVYVTLNNKTLPPKDYPFDTVLVATFQWDTGIARALTASEFDLLYPLQREINKIAAKLQQLIRNYKGPVPVFNSDVELAMKNITNGAGECLYVDSSRSVDSLMSVINPTPLDPQFSAEITNYKTAMYELAGIQNASFDMENMRSAAAVIALDQTRDSIFQAQLSGLAEFIKSSLMLYFQFFAQYPNFTPDRKSVDWQAIYDLARRSYINLQPVHINDLLSDEEQAKQKPIDYMKLATARCTLGVIKGSVTYDTLPYYIDPKEMTLTVAATLIKFEALGIEIPYTLHLFLVSAFIDTVVHGENTL